MAHHPREGRSHRDGPLVVCEMMGSRSRRCPTEFQEDAMADPTDAYTRTRRCLHALAELVVAGPRFRETGDLRLRVRSEGLGTWDGPVVALSGGELVTPTARIAVDGLTISEAAREAGLEAAPWTTSTRTAPMSPRRRQCTSTPRRSRWSRRPSGSVTTPCASSARRGTHALARALRRRHHRRRRQLRCLPRRRLPRPALRLRRSARPAHRRLLERPLRRRPPRRRTRGRRRDHRASSAKGPARRPARCPDPLRGVPDPEVGYSFSITGEAGP